MVLGKAKKERATADQAQHTLHSNAWDAYKTPTRQLEREMSQHRALPYQLDTAFGDDDTAADTSQPYTVHLYSPLQPEPRLVNANLSGGRAFKQSMFNGMPQQQYGLDAVRQQAEPTSMGLSGQHRNSLPMGQLQSRQVHSGLMQSGPLTSSQLQLRTPARPNSAGSALRGYVPPEHR